MPAPDQDDVWLRNGAIPIMGFFNQTIAGAAPPRCSAMSA
jgi:hypothetical protein